MFLFLEQLTVITSDLTIESSAGISQRFSTTDMQFRDR